jgi:hypothetical protein
MADPASTEGHQQNVKLLGLHLTVLNHDFKELQVDIFRKHTAS